MLKNTLDIISHAVGSLHFNDSVVRADIDEKRILPYSIVFDLLDFFNDDELTQTVRESFINSLHKNDYENKMDLWIDLESKGEVTVIFAKKLATTIINFMQDKNLDIHLIINLKAKMTRDNQLFIHYLQESNNRIVISYADVTKNTVVNLPLHDEYYLNWFSAGKMTYCLDQENVFKYAWSCAEMGAEEVGFRVLEMGYQQASDIYLQQLYLVQLQFLRIASQHYWDASEEQRSIAEQFHDLVRLNNLAKAWGCVLSQQLSNAEHYFQLAGVTKDHVPKNIDDLCRMNIFALLQHLRGRGDDALHIELRIKNAISELNKPCPQITYINSISLARLYKYADRFEEAKYYYDLAFSIARGAKSETDYIYEKVCYGKLHEKQGKHQLALISWLKAAIYWLVAKSQDALGWRAVRVIAQPNFKPRSYLNVDIINEAFIAKLINLADKNKLNTVSNSSGSSNFSLFEDMSNLVNSVLYRQPDLSLFLKKAKKAIENHENESKNILMSIVSALLVQLLNIDGNGTYNFIIDKDKL